MSRGPTLKAQPLISSCFSTDDRDLLAAPICMGSPMLDSEEVIERTGMGKTGSSRFLFLPILNASSQAAIITQCFQGIWGALLPCSSQRSSFIWTGQLGLSYSTLQWQQVEKKVWNILSTVPARASKSLIYLWFSAGIPKVSFEFMRKVLVIVKNQIVFFNEQYCPLGSCFIWTLTTHRHMVMTAIPSWPGMELYNSASSAYLWYFIHITSHSFM